jgi:AcrR family transcriptional regulator
VSAAATRARRRYHHGDLPRAIRDTALALIAERGLPSFSLRELASRIGVAHAAVYAHYAGKQELLAELAVAGLESLNRHQRAALSRTHGGALARLLAIAHAYVDFARLEPGAYRLVFNINLGTLDSARVQSARASAAALMFEVIGEGQAEGLFVDAAPDALAVALWGPAHGLAALVLSGQIREMPAAAADLDGTLELAVECAVRGVLSERGRAALAASGAARHATLPRSYP